MTPYDLEVAGTFAEKPRSERADPRRLTPEEVRANNRIPIFKEDLENMNRNKVGAPFKYSDALIFWMTSVLSGFDSTFRYTDGFLTGILDVFGVPVPSPTRFLERSNQLFSSGHKKLPKEVANRYGDHVYAIYISPNVVDRPRRLGIDGSGLSLSNPNRWRLKKWEDGPKDRGWLHLHSLSDVDTGEFIGCILGDETVGDAPQLRPLVQGALDKGHRISVVYGDGAYCSDDNRKFLCSEKKIRFVTSFRIDTSPTNNGCAARGEAARLWCSLPYDELVKESGYGTRWKCECSFSDFKTIFPETVTATSQDGIVRQVMSGVSHYNEYKDLRARNMGVTGNGVVLY